jgi:hypothetical protein
MRPWLQKVAIARRIIATYSRGSRFLSYNFLQFAIDGKNNSKTKVEKVFFFEIGGYEVQKIRNFTLISKWGFLSLYLAPFKS